MTWNDRVVRTEDEAEVSYAISEVYSDNDGRSEARTGRPGYPAGETLEALCEDVQHSVAALDQPVLHDALCGRAGDAPSGVDAEEGTHDRP
jgi:hypothetical protein